MTLRARLRVNPWLLLAFAIVLGWSVPKLFSGARAPADALAYTDCPWRGPARVTMTAGVASADSAPVMAHESVHVDQCTRLGPARYRLRNLTVAGRMSLEAPAYCAGAGTRRRQGQPVERVRERLLEDVAAAFAGALDTGEVRAALRAACPELSG